ncbi:MAG: TRADD-N-associated membrane domain-containing protein [Nostoc sp.]
MNNKPTPKSHSIIELSIAQERLRQARYSFNIALTATALSACIGLVGAGLLLLGKVTEGTVTAAGGMAASVRCVQLAKDTNDRLDKILAQLDDET